MNFSYPEFETDPDTGKYRAEEILKDLSLLKPGERFITGDYIQPAFEYQVKYRIRRDRFNVMAPDLPYSQTVVAHLAKDGHPDINQLRSIFIREAARLESFPDNFYFESSMTVIYFDLSFGEQLIFPKNCSQGGIYEH